MILVTGANGFIGQVVMQRLEAAGMAARGATRAPLAGMVAIGNLDGATDWSAALAGVDTVIHLAACAHGRQLTAADPLHELRTVNRDATLHLAAMAAQAGVKRFIYISSVKVNGERTQGAPFTPEDTLRPEDAYGMSKAEAEVGLQAMAAQTGMELVIIRPPLVYGPGVKANFATMMRVVQRRLPLPFGAVRNRRSLVYVENLADLIVRCVTHPAAANQVFMVSDAQDVSTTELLRKLAHTFRKPGRLLPVPVGLMQFAARMFGKADMAQRLLGSLQVDIGKTQTLLDWTPPFTLDQGLRKTAAEFLRAHQ